MFGVNQPVVNVIIIHTDVQGDCRGTDWHKCQQRFWSAVCFWCCVLWGNFSIINYNHFLL